MPLNKPVSQKWLEGVFSDAFGHRLAVHCGYGKGPPILQEVWMCLDAQMQPFDCPRNVYRRCHGDVTLPSMHHATSTDVPQEALNPGDFVPPNTAGMQESMLMSRMSTIQELVSGDGVAFADTA